MPRTKPDCSEAMPKSTFDIICYHFYTLWLFNFSDLKTMVFPSTAFAIFNGIALSQPCYTPNCRVEFTTLLKRLPIVLLWTWINLLAFTVNNQRSQRSVKEDRLNKPWRPLPAGRLTLRQARNFALLLYPITILTSVKLGGGTAQCVLLWFLGYIYHDLAGGDANWLIRNILNAFGFTSFASGALEVAMQSPIEAGLMPWLLIIGAIVCTTVHTQDMYDQLGDSAAGRKTLPLVIGDGPARWSIALLVSAWSWLCPMYWQSSLAGYLAPVALGLLISLRSRTKVTVEEDKTTFRIYNAWLVSIYMLPFLRS